MNATTEKPKHTRVLPDVESPNIDVTRWLKDFDNYLSQVQGLAPSTRQRYCFYASRFLREFCGTAGPDWSSLRGEDLAVFVQREASRLKRKAREAPGIAIRSLLRYLTFAGVIRQGLEAAVPRMPQWKHAELPRYLPADEVERVVLGHALSEPGLCEASVRVFTLLPDNRAPASHDRELCIKVKYAVIHARPDGHGTIGRRRQHKQQLF